MKHSALVKADGSVSLVSTSPGVTIDIPGTVSKLPLSAAEYKEMHDKLQTHEARFDKVKNKVVFVTKQESK